MQQEWHALCIVNTRKRAQRLYEQLQGEGVYHLSTTMYPVHRKRVLAEIRERLDDKKGKNVSSFRPVSWKPGWIWILLRYIGN